MTKRQLTLPTLCHHSQLEFALVAQCWLTHQIHGRCMAAAGPPALQKQQLAHLRLDLNFLWWGAVRWCAHA